MYAFIEYRLPYLISLTLLLTAGIQLAHSQTLSAEQRTRIQQLISQKMAADQIPGASVAIMVDHELVWSRGYGLADVENYVPATEHTAYRSASIGKTITATAVMHAVERGLIDLDAPIQRYCPAFPAKSRPVTTRQLLAHTSGIRHYGGPDNEAELFSAVHYDDVQASLKVFAADSLLHAPGARHTYSTYGYNVLGCVLEGAGGTDFMSYLQRHIFQPAGMTATQVDDPSAIIPGRAAGYRRDSTGRLLNARYVDMSNKIPAGGYITTAEDLVRFAAAFMDDRLVKADTRASMLTPQKTNDGEVFGYGLGWGLFPGEDWYGEKEAFHGGQTPGVSGMLYLLPGRHFAVAILMNLESVGGRVELAAEIAKVVLNLNK